MAIKIITDSTCDLPESIVTEFGVSIVPLKVLFGEEEYRDRYDIKPAEFYAKMKNHKQLPTTAQVNPGEFIEEFSRHILNGDEILGIFISAKLSGTYSSAVMAKDSIGQAKIHVIDSKSASFGLGLLVIEAGRMVRQGKSATEIVERIESIKKDLPFYGVIDNLENLKKGGRLSATSAFAGSLLGIKPIITLADGVVTLIGKARGQKKAFAWVLDDVKAKKIDFNNKTVAVAHTASAVAAGELKKLILSEYSPKEIIEFEIGSVIGTHTGEGCVGLSCLPE